jgi:recombinational DNA repair protein RecT
LYEADAVKIVKAFLQCSQTDLQVIIRKCLYEADAVKIVGAFLQCSQTDLQVIIRKCLYEIAIITWRSVCEH